MISLIKTAHETESSFVWVGKLKDRKPNVEIGAEFYLR